MDDMLANGITKIVDLARAARHTVLLDDVRSRTVFDHNTGSIDTIEKQLPPICHVLTDLDSLADFVTLFSENEDCANEEFVMFIRDVAIVGIFDYGGHRLDRVTVPMTKSPIVNFLQSGGSGDPKAMLKHLKFQLKSAVVSPPDLFERLTVLRFESQSESVHSNKSQDEAVSSSLKSRVSGAAELPSEFDVSFSFYPDLDEQIADRAQVTVRMELHVDPSAGTITLRAFPGAIESATVSALMSVKKEILRRFSERNIELGNRVFLGTP